MALCPLAYAQSGEETVFNEIDFDLPASEASDLVADGGLDLGDVDFEGNPLKRFAEKWPEDLVVAPIPGRSPPTSPTTPTSASASSWRCASPASMTTTSSTARR